MAGTLVSVGSLTPQEDRARTNRIFHDRKKTIMRKCHEAATIDGRPGVEIEVTIKDGEDWYTYQSGGWADIERENLKGRADFIDQLGPGDFITHNQAVKAGMNSSSPRRSSSSSSPRPTPVIKKDRTPNISFNRSVRGSSVSRYDSSNLSDTLFCDEGKNASAYASSSSSRNQAELSYFSDSPLSQIGVDPITVEHRAAQGPQQNVADHDSLFADSPRPTPSISGFTDADAEYDWAHCFGTSELSGIRSSPGPTISTRGTPRGSKSAKQPLIPPTKSDSTTSTNLQQMDEKSESFDDSASHLEWAKTKTTFNLSQELPERRRVVEYEKSDPADDLEDVVPDIVPVPPPMAPLRSTSRARRKSPDGDLQEGRKDGPKRHCL